MLILSLIISSRTPVVLAQTENTEQILINIAEKIARATNEVISKQEDSIVDPVGQIEQEEEELIIESFRDVPTQIPDMDEVKKQVEFASKVTGVRKEFLMGMLVVESDLGKNTGKCTYQEVKEGAEKAHASGRLSKKSWKTFQKRKAIIEDIAEELGYDSDKLKVSCNPGYAGTGGAMGIPQFMPDTWMEYRDEIVAITGNAHPDPWSVRDGVLAMALKVSDVPGVVDHNIQAERKASKMYLSGSSSGRYEWYASKIQYWAKNYEKLNG